ncbi:hypothetical protein CQ057_04645 [Ochrobactrum sp. MYb49]|nr:hypothetical protein TR92_08370 [Brucella anthropi]PQZ65864.1 hypothetical protein CQ057_04645 [Ochrobactrum sp. MYb49]
MASQSLQHLERFHSNFLDKRERNFSMSAPQALRDNLGWREAAHLVHALPWNEFPVFNRVKSDDRNGSLRR